MKTHILILILTTQFALAGERGYKAAGIDIGSKKFWESNYFKEWENDDRIKSTEPCWEKRAARFMKIRHLINYSLPEGINHDMASNLITKKQESIKKAKKILTTYREKGISSGLDGLYITKLEGNTLTVYGFGARNGIIISSKNITLDPANIKQSVTKFDKALCEVSAPLDFGFGI